MNFATLFLQLLPLLVFIVADAIFNNPKLSILLAIITAAVQMTLYYRQTTQIDWFIFLDVALIAALGGVSIVLNNDLFFKLKPAIIDIVAIILFLVFIFSPDTFLFNYMNRIMHGQRMSLRPEMIPTMKLMLGWICFYFAVHAGAVVYTTLRCSRKVWAFVAGPGLYLLFIPVMFFILFKRIYKKKQTVSTNVKT